MSMFSLNSNLLKQLPEKERRITLATCFTVLRIVLVPFIIRLMIAHDWKNAGILFCIAAATDAIDGGVARFLHEQTVLGACLDPIADKLLILPCFFTLAYLDAPFMTVPFWFAMIVLLKEIIIFSGVALLYKYRGSVSIKPTFLGKITTVAQIFFISTFFAHFLVSYVSSFFYYASLICTLILVCLSFIQYVRIGLDQWFNRKYL